MRRLGLVVLAALLFAGCVDPSAPEEPLATEEPQIVIDENRPAPEFGEVITGPAVGPDLNATTAAAPRLVAGEWWRIKYSNLFLGEEDVEFVRVVADVHDEGYVFGMPHEGWYKEAIAYHAPAFGDVALDLSYATHNVVFQPVRFPLVAGDTWETHFAASPFIAKVESADLTTATISLTSAAEPQPTDPIMALLGMSSSGPDMTITYDAQMHEVVRMESGIGIWEVIAHGYDYEGWVTVPRGEHTAIDYGTFGGPVGETHTPLPGEVEVDGGFNRMTLMHLVVGLVPGAYKVRSVTPQGEEFLTESVGSTDMVLRFYEAKEPDGVWTTEDVLIGAGATYSMGIAYHQYDIKVPEGLRRADHSHPVIR